VTLPKVFPAVVVCRLDVRGAPLAITHHIDRERRVVLTFLEGAVDDAQAVDCIQCLRDDPDFEPSLNQLIDCTAVSDFRITSAGIRAVTYDAPFGEGSRRAVVAPQQAIFGMARMLQLLSRGPSEINVFRSVNEARAWLGLD
jgi:hypothetical protein